MASLDERRLNRAARRLKEARYAIALTGAGISTPSGVPDFRSPGSGLWEQVDPLEVASIYSFRHHPERFYNWIRPLAGLTLTARPNPAHQALAALEAAGVLKAVITQNIDGLHQAAGSRRIIEVHGHLRQATCMHCYAHFPARPIIERFIEDGEVPRCPRCGGVIKPDVVLFGEQLPARAFYEAQQEARRCDLMLIVGSSLEVAPAGDLPLLAHEAGAHLILINREATHMDALAEAVFHADVAVVLPRLAARALAP
ncbi:MAG: RNA polymerase subunit sigma [Chloroflexota bacterium]